MLLHVFKPDNLKKNFNTSIDFEKTDYNIFNKYTIYKFN